MRVLVRLVSARADSPAVRMSADENQHQAGVKRRRLSSSRYVPASRVCLPQPLTADSQHAKLEKIYSGFLERFGPRGLFTPFGVSLIAPKFREEAHRAAHEPNDTGSSEDAKDYLDGSYGSVIIPEEILRGVAAMRDDWDEEEDDSLLPAGTSSNDPATLTNPATVATNPATLTNPANDLTRSTTRPVSERPTAAPISTAAFYAAESSQSAEPSSSLRIDPRESFEADKTVKAEALARHA